MLGESIRDVWFEDHYYNYSREVIKNATYNLQFDLVKSFVESFIRLGYDLLQHLPRVRVAQRFWVMQRTIPKDLSSLHELYDVNQISMIRTVPGEGLTTRLTMAGSTSRGCSGVGRSDILVTRYGMFNVEI